MRPLETGALRGADEGARGAPSPPRPRLRVDDRVAVRRSALPPVSETVAHSLGEPSPNVTELIWIGEARSHAGALNDWQIGAVSRQREAPRWS